MRMEKVDFVFEYEVKSREFNNVCLIAAYLKNKGYSTAIVNSWQCLYQKPPAYQAEVAVISACYNDGTYDYFTGHIANFKKVVNMQWEQVLVNYYREETNSTYEYRGAGKNTQHVCWGTKEKDWMKEKFDIDEKYLKVVGYLPLDFYRNELKNLFPSRQKLFEKYGLAPGKKTLLFVSSFTSIDLPDTEDHGDDEVFFLSKNTSFQTQTILIKWFERLVREYPEIQVVYRYHPAEKSSKEIQELVRTNENIYAIADLPISNWIMVCDKVYNWCSTSMVEMMFSEKDVYLLRPVTVPRWIDYPFFENVQYIDTYEKFVQSAMESKMKDLPIDPEMITEWYDIQEKPTYQRLGDWLIEIYHSDDYTSRPSNQNMHLFSVKKEIKKLVKRAIAYTRMAEFLSLAGENVLVKRLKNIQEEVRFEDAHRRAVREKDGYIQNKCQLNGTSQEEIHETIKRYQRLICS